MTSVVLVAFLIPLGLLARTLNEERALGAARQDAQSAAVLVDDPVRLDAVLQSINGAGRQTTVFSPDGRTYGAPAERTDSVRLAAAGQAFTARTAGGAEVLVPVASGDGVTVVRTFVPEAHLSAGVSRAWTVLVVVGLALLGVTAVAGDRIAARLSRSVSELADAAERLGAGDLTARVEPSGPKEVASVGVVLNRLGARVTDLLADERELIADLSHRLRTPITALRLDTDLLADPDERTRLTHHVDELVAAVDAVIAEARRHEPRGAVRCDAAVVVRDRARFWEVLATAQQRPFTVVAPAAGSLPVPVTPAALGAALDVLVENVFRHTPARTRLELRVEARADEVVVSVADDGPGLASLENVVRGSSGAGASGLGLDVARRTATDAGGRLELAARSSGSGTQVSLVFPTTLAES